MLVSSEKGPPDFLIHACQEKRAYAPLCTGFSDSVRLGYGLAPRCGGFAYEPSGTSVCPAVDGFSDEPVAFASLDVRVFTSESVSGR